MHFRSAVPRFPEDPVGIRGPQVVKSSSNANGWSGWLIRELYPRGREFAFSGGLTVIHIKMRKLGVDRTKVKCNFWNLGGQKLTSNSTE